MKKLFIFAMAIGLAACTTDKTDITGGEGNLSQQYLAVNLVPAPDNGTRGEGDPMQGDPNATYEEGYAKENKVEKVRFYFFNNSGVAARVKSDGTNYFDWTPGDEFSQDMPNVEKQLEAVVVISTPAGDDLPQRIIAVINPETEGLTDTNSHPLNTLRDRTRDYAADASAADAKFVMTNAVYANAATTTATVVASTAITTQNYASSADAAKANPVNIYVERNVAKVRVKFDEGITITSDNRIALRDSENKPILVGDRQVYLKISKWSLTAYTKDGYLSKHISSAWNVGNSGTSLFGTAQWNWPAYFRSFWAMNTQIPAGQQNNQTWINYNQIGTTGKGYKELDNEKNNQVLYTNENAPQTIVTEEEPSIEDFTKVILAGELVYDDGSAVQLAKYAGIEYIGEAALKTALLESFKKNNNMIYSYTTESGVAFSELVDGDVEFKTAINSDLTESDDNVDASEGTTGRYYVYLQLTEQGLGKTWTKVNDPDTYNQAENLLSTDEVNQYLVATIGKSQIYKNGLTYYYFPIEHLGDEGHVGQYGVVRNHIYDCTINSIKGLGTPVYDPTETIYPEKPQDDETYIAARINILSWRVVSSNVDLEW